QILPGDRVGDEHPQGAVPVADTRGGDARPSLTRVVARVVDGYDRRNRYDAGGRSLELEGRLNHVRRDAGYRPRNLVFRAIFSLARDEYENRVRGLLFSANLLQADVDAGHPRQREELVLESVPDREQTLVLQRINVHDVPPKRACCRLRAQCLQFPAEVDRVRSLHLPLVVRGERRGQGVVAARVHEFLELGGGAEAYHLALNEPARGDVIGGVESEDLLEIGACVDGADGLAVEGEAHRTRIHAWPRYPGSAGDAETCHVGFAVRLEQRPVAAVVVEGGPALVI